jgi:hypothetical protein
MLVARAPWFKADSIEVKSWLCHELAKKTHQKSEEIMFPSGVVMRCPRLMLRLVG